MTNQTDTQTAISAGDGLLDAERRADRDLKARHRVMWALGDYPAMAHDLVAPLGPRLVRACDVRPGERVLDVAAGTGNSAVAAASLGADVVASDLTPELLEAGRRRSDADGLELRWQQDDAENLSFADAEFDVVLSCIGVMFAPHHQRAADELVRVCRPGGRIGLLSWTPAGFVGQLFATMRPFAPPPPPGSQPAPLWGSADHVRQLLGAEVVDLTFRTETLLVSLFPTPQAFAHYFKTHYGPTVAVYRSLAARPADVAVLDHALADLARRHAVPGTVSLEMEWEYLIVTATVRPV